VNCSCGPCSSWLRKATFQSRHQKCAANSRKWLLMKMLNRNAVIVKPRQPYRDWIASLEGSHPDDYDKEDTEFPVYLLPETWNMLDFQRILKRYFPIIFAQELYGWARNEEDWPRRRGWRTLCAWFEVEFGSEVLDLVDGPLWVEDL